MPAPTSPPPAPAELRLLYAIAHDAVLYGHPIADDARMLGDDEILELAADFFRAAGSDPEFLHDPE